MITRYTSPKVTEPAPELWSNCIVCDGIAYIAGLTSRNADGVTIDGADEYEQTKIIFEKHKALIEAAGGKMGILRSSPFLSRAFRTTNRCGRQGPSFLKAIFLPVPQLKFQTWLSPTSTWKLKVSPISEKAPFKEVQSQKLIFIKYF